MGLFNFHKQRPTPSVQTPFKNADAPLTSQQIEDAKLEIIKLNILLKGNKYTAHLKMNPEKITPDSYIRLTPYTEKTKKPSKYPRMISISSTMYQGYSITLYYTQNGDIGKGNILIFASNLTYTIDLKTVNSQLCIVKIMTTDEKNNTEKLYHIKADGTVFEK